jgi:hypothetical protein
VIPIPQKWLGQVLIAVVIAVVESIVVRAAQKVR